MATSHIEGIDDLRRALKKAGKDAPFALASAMVVEQEKVMAEAKRITPVNKLPGVSGGTLRASGTVLPPEISGTRITVASGFGGAASKYALRQHEELEYKHETGQAKFLETPFNERKPQMIRNLATGVYKVLKRLGKG